MPTIQQLFQTVQADQNAVNTAVISMAQALSSLMVAQANYQTALTNMIMAENTGNQQMIDMAASALAAANSVALASESAYNESVTVFQAADTQLQTDRVALNAALKGDQAPKKKTV